MENNNKNNNWSEWSKFVLKELERLSVSSEKTVEIVNQLPCSSYIERFTNLDNKVEKIITNDLKHINEKINTLLFTVLGSVIITVIVFAIKFLVNYATIL